MYKFKLEIRTITPEEYQLLRGTTGWSILEKKTVVEALKKDLFSVCVMNGTKTVGIGRVIGDGAIYFYLQDIIVLPEYHKKGVGTLLMNAIDGYLREVAGQHSFIGLMAAQDTIGFYQKFDFKKRPENGPGMYKIIGRN